MELAITMEIYLTILALVTMFHSSRHVCCPSFIPKNIEKCFLDG